MFGARERVLDNGLRVVVLESHRAPVVHHMFWFSAGAADDVPGAHGAAHYLEHLMFKGGGGLEPGEYSRRVRAMGGRENAFTGRDCTAYYATVPAESLEDVMRLESMRFSGFDVGDQEMDRELAVVRAERDERTESDPAARLYESVMAALFPGHPYGRPVIGTEEDLAVLGPGGARAFFGAHYGLSGATLIVAGDVEAEAVFALAQEAYDSLGPSSSAHSAIPDAPGEVGAPEVMETHPSVRQPLFVRAWRAPPRSYALEVAVQALGGGPTSHLYRSLVVEQGLTSALDLSYHPDARGPATVTLSAWPAPGVTPGELGAALDAALADFAADEAAVARAKNSLLAQAVYDRDSLDGPAQILGWALCTGTPLAVAEAWPARIDAVAPEDVRAAVDGALRGPEAAFVTGVLMPYSGPSSEENN